MPETETTETETTETKSAEGTETETKETQEGSETTPIEVPDDHPLAKALKAERQAARDARAELRTARAELETAQATISSLTTKADEATSKVSALETDLADATGTVLRFAVAAEKGLDLTLADRLKGATKEELEADADTLLTLAPGGGFDGGARLNRAPTTKDPGKAHGQLIARILRGEPIED